MKLSITDKRLGLFLCLAVVLLASFLFLFKLGDRPFWDYDEALYANLITDTLRSGDILTLKVGDSPLFEKPPLVYWLAMGANTLFHDPEFAYRFPAAVAGIVAVILVMLIAYELTGNLFVSFLAGLMLLSTGPFLDAGRQVRLDLPAIACDLFAVYAFLKGLKKPIWFLALAPAFAVGFLSKSVIGVLSIFFIFSWSLIRRDFAWLKEKYLWIGSVLGLAIFAPWHVYETITYGSAFWESYVGYALFQRFSSDIIGTSTTFGNYLKFFFQYAAPWTTLFAIEIVWLLTQIKKYKSEELYPVFALALTGVLIFILFGLSTTKIFYYLLPVYPFVALALAVGSYYLLRNVKQFPSLLSIAAPILMVIGLGVSISFGYHSFSIVKNNDLIVKNEEEVGNILARNPQPDEVYTYQHDYWDTIRYYSGRKNIRAIQEDELLEKPFFLVLQTPLAKSNPFPQEFSAHLTSYYQGEVLTLYKFQP